MTTMPGKLFDLLFGCTHKHLSFPISMRRGRRRSPAAGRTGTYIVCLDCGKEMPYDWQRMEILEPQEVSRPREPRVAA